ncbi:hypothetical protein [Cupriavidus nantongensis]|uniref:Uncharacterized protein n=1 Tax=Cupriavidus nantongensis TaxID=1796606 RepID=A0A142JMX7_9BURK|nr:hypothetical protein [Cupriavidus nantongensis]AMR79439.1 hypothetical protein A2G96_17775 [Cupriavidus nantongensis]
MKHTELAAAKFLAGLAVLLLHHEECEPDELENAHENADDGGNFNDTLDSGIALGERLLADEIRGLAERCGVDLEIKPA